MQEFTRSSRKNPCPVCSRTKDGDCSIKEAGNLVLCHTHTQDCAEGQAQNYKYLHLSKDGLWGVWVYQEVGTDGKVKGRKPERLEKGYKHFFYQDRQGQPLIKVSRISREGGKDFRQYKWDGVEYKPGLNEFAKRNVPIYRYREVRQAIEQGKVVFFVEGEGKADELWDLGIPATTTIGGSKGYRAYGSYQEDLRGAKLVLCPDRDKTGIAYMEEVAKDFPESQWCYVFPDSALWRHIPDNGGLDIADWIAEGATTTDIWDAVGEKRGIGQPRSVAQVEDESKVPRLVREYHLLKDTLGRRLRFNSLTKEIELDSKSINLDRIKLELAVFHDIYLKSSREDIQDMICTLAEENEYSPVVEYLESCHQRYGNDTNVLSDFAERYFGQTGSIYNTMAIRTLIGAVARAYKPGCKHDTALILQGKQGFFKSSFFRILAGAEWFDDSLGAISDKDERLKLHRVWFVEWSELETIFRRKDVSQAKAFLSSATDHLRPPYGRTVECLSRHSVIVGTTNLDEFLSDSTGNRRFWVIPVCKPIDTQALKAERDRIWAAAVALYKAGHQWHLNPQEEIIAEAIAKEFQTRDPWHDLIAAYAASRSVIAIREVLGELLNIEPGRQERAQMMRVAEILRELGWKKAFTDYQGRRQKVWLNLSDPPSDPPDPPQIEGGSEETLANWASDPPDPPDPPVRNFHPKINTQHPPSKITQISEIGGSGGSGGSKLVKSLLSNDPPQKIGGSGGSEGGSGQLFQNGYRPPLTRLTLAEIESDEGWEDC
jgi:predicted P-loop ATPase